MFMKRVLIGMVVVGVLLLGYSLRLHEHVMTVDGDQARHGCRQLCKLKIGQVTAEATGPLAELADLMAGSACEALSDEGGPIGACRDKMLGHAVSVATYRCVIRATSLDEARACGEGLQ